MLTVVIPKSEFWDEKKEAFINIEGCSFNIEHSLVSLSKWESKWKKPFLSKDNKTKEEQLDYIRCMTITQNVDPKVYNFISNKQFMEIDNYINNSMTATTFSDSNTNNKNEIITAEIIYYWMITLNIPFECQKWHLQRLLTLIKVCSIKSSPQKKMTTREIMSRNKSLNKARKAKYNTKG